MRLFRCALLLLGVAGYLFFLEYNPLDRFLTISLDAKEAIVSDPAVGTSAGGQE